MKQVFQFGIAILMIKTHYTVLKFYVGYQEQPQIGLAGFAIVAIVVVVQHTLKTIR